MKKYTDKEQQILAILWRLKEASVQEVHDELDSSSGYTTTLKLMQIMLDKEYLQRRKQGKKHVYFSVVDKQKVQGSGIKKMMKGLFGGSKIDLVQSFLGNTNPTKEELEAIKELIKKIEKDVGDS